MDKLRLRCAMAPIYGWPNLSTETTLARPLRDLRGIFVQNEARGLLDKVLSFGENGISGISGSSGINLTGDGKPSGYLMIINDG